MRRAGIAALIVVVAVALTGCVGIPTSGPVTAGGIIDEEIAPDFGYDPSGPPPGATPAEIITGFIQAATNPQNDYDVARQFLSSSIADSWEPNEITQVRSGAGTTQENPDGSYSYAFSSSAYVSNAGQYTAGDQTSQKLDFALVQNRDGEWRLSEAPDGIVLSAEGFDTIFTHYALYYFDSTYEYLVPDVRWFPRTTRVATRLVSTLLNGQATWLAQGITNSEFPTGTRLVSTVAVESGVATVDLSEEVLDASPEARARMAEQLKNTIGSVSSVVITVNGVAIDVPEIAIIPVLNPGVQPQLLARTDDAFGFLNASGGVTPVAGQSSEIVLLGATAVTLARDRALAALRAPDGVHVVFSNSDDQLLLDARPDVIAPSTDNSGFVWTVSASDASAIRAFSAQGARTDITTGITPGTWATSFAISRDGSRLMLYTATDVGTQLTVYGILRTDGVPYALGPAFDLRVDQSLMPLDATWVDDRTIATLATQPATGSSVVTVHEIGGQSLTIGRVVDGAKIVGGSDEDGLRVVTSTGEVYRPRGTGWASTGVSVLFLATQQ